MTVTGINELRITIVDRRLLLTQRDQPCQFGEDTTVRRTRIMTYLFLPGPISLRAMNPAAIASFIWIGDKRVIVQCAHLVSQVEQRDTADAENNAVQQ